MNPTASEQKMAALAKANEVRRARSELKTEMAEGVRTLAEVLRADEDFVQSMRIGDLLLAVPGVGRVSAARALRACQLSASTQLRLLPTVRRERLIAWLAENRKAVDVGPEIERELWGGKGGYR